MHKHVRNNLPNAKGITFEIESRKRLFQRGYRFTSQEKDDIDEQDVFGYNRKLIEHDQLKYSFSCCASN